MVRKSFANLKNSKPKFFHGREHKKIKSAPDCSRATRGHEGASGSRTRLKNRTRQNRSDILPATKLYLPPISPKGTPGGQHDSRPLPENTFLFAVQRLDGERTAHISLDRIFGQGRAITLFESVAFLSSTKLLVRSDCIVFAS